MECQQCHIEFTPRRSWGVKFCSRKCAEKARHPSHPRNWVTAIVFPACKGCGRLFTAKKRDYACGSCRYCSPSCWYRRNAGVKRHLCKQCGTAFASPCSFFRSFCSRECMHIHRGNDRVCKQCGKKYRAPTSTKQHFCSAGCYFAWKSDARRTAACEQCGHEYKLKNLASRFCCRDCWRTYQSTHRAPNFRGERLQERGKHWQEISRDIRERGNKVCGGCGSPEPRRHRLHVDHIVPYRLILKFQADNPLLDPNHIDNLIPLCLPCHMRKTGAENNLLRGDVLGFIRRAKAIIPLERIEWALTFYGLQPRKAS